jgi:hypothetical protein
VNKKLNTLHKSWGALLLHELLDGWFELCRMVRRVDALACANDAERSLAVRSLLGIEDDNVRTDDEANLLLAPRPCVGDALISVRDSLLDIEPM